MPTVIGAIIVFGIFGAIVGKAIYNRMHHKGGCSCGDCAGCGGCHVQKNMDQSR